MQDSTASPALRDGNGGGLAAAAASGGAAAAGDEEEEEEEEAAAEEEGRGEHGEEEKGLLPGPLAAACSQARCRACLQARVHSETLRLVCLW